MIDSVTKDIQENVNCKNEFSSIEKNNKFYIIMKGLTMKELSIDPNFYTSKPSSNNREKKEMMTYELLEQLDIPYIRLDHEATATIEACKRVEEMFQISICKNLFLCNTQKTSFYLLMMPGDKKFKTSELTKQIGTSRLSFADANDMEKLLNVTPGSVTVLALQYDTDCKVQLLIDRDLLSQEYIGCHPCVNTASLKLTMRDIIEKFLVSISHSPIIVDL